MSHLARYPVLLLVLALAPAPFVTLAADEHPACLLLLREERVERDDLALEIDLARSELSAAEQIFVLLDGLWQSEAVERFAYLAGKHSRDAARADVAIAETKLLRQQAVLDQYELLCATQFGGKADAEQRRSLEQAHHRFRDADCRALGGSLERAEIDLAYDLELLASVADLRKNNVATRQDVILSERDVAMTRQRIAQLTSRVDLCRRETAALEKR